MQVRAALRIHQTYASGSPSKHPRRRKLHSVRKRPRASRLQRATATAPRRWAVIYLAPSTRRGLPRENPLCISPGRFSQRCYRRRKPQGARAPASLTRNKVNCAAKRSVRDRQRGARQGGGGGAPTFAEYVMSPTLRHDVNAPRKSRTRATAPCSRCDAHRGSHSELAYMGALEVARTPCARVSFETSRWC